VLPWKLVEPSLERRRLLILLLVEYDSNFRHPFTPPFLSMILMQRSRDLGDQAVGRWKKNRVPSVDKLVTDGTDEMGLAPPRQSKGRDILGPFEKKAAHHQWGDTGSMRCYTLLRTEIG
jgi:hypothetical protein